MHGWNCGQNEASSVLLEHQIFTQTPAHHPGLISISKYLHSHKIFIHAHLLVCFDHRTHRQKVCRDWMVPGACLPVKMHKQMNKYRLAKRSSSGPAEGVRRKKGEMNKSWHTSVYTNNRGKRHAWLPTGDVARVNTLSDKTRSVRWALLVERLPDGSIRGGLWG